MSEKKTEDSHKGFTLDVVGKPKGYYENLEKENRELRNKNAELHRFAWWVIQVYSRNVQDLIASIKEAVTYETVEAAKKGEYSLPRKCFVISERLEVYNQGIQDGSYLDPEILKEVSK